MGDDQAKSSTDTKTRSTLKQKWYQLTSSFRLKVNDHDFKNLLFNHPENKSPQAIQGKWQAYGQMRAARTLGRFAVFGTGVAGVMLWIYQQNLTSQSRALRKSMHMLEEMNKNSDKDIYVAEQIAHSQKVHEKQLAYAELKIRSLCEGKTGCYEEYKSAKEDIGKSMPFYSKIRRGK